MTDRDNQGTEPPTQDEDEIIPRNVSPSVLSDQSSAAMPVPLTSNEEPFFVTEHFPTVNTEATLSTTPMPPTSSISHVNK